MRLVPYGSRITPSCRHVINHVPGDFVCPLVTLKIDGRLPEVCDTRGCFPCPSFLGRPRHHDYSVPEVVTVEDATVENATVANVGDVEEDNAPAYNASLYDWADQTYGYHIPDDGAVGPFYCVTQGLRVGVFASW
jgi:hypothetical protein